MNTSAAISNIEAVQRSLAVIATLNLTAHLWPRHAEVSDGDCFDYIVVGAGSAGSVIANRLTEDKDVTVLLIEAGGDPPIESTIPALFPYLKNTSVDWKSVAKEDGFSVQFHKNNRSKLTSGKMLGGGSSINFMMYTRGNYHDFDNWARITGDNSWAWENVLEYFKKSERQTDPTILNSADAKYHGTDGYLGVERVHYETAEKYYKVFEELGIKYINDSNNGYPLGVTDCPFTIADGIRQSTAYAFLYRAKDRPNLYVSKNTHVTHVLVDCENNAFGVKAILSNNKIVKLKAYKEVILSAGTLKTPQILMLSGIGHAEHLKQMNITVIQDLPVGQRVNDHVMMMMAHKMGNATQAEALNPGHYPSTTLLSFATVNKDQNYPDYETANFILPDPIQTLQYCIYFEYDNEICDAIFNGCLGKEVFMTFLIFVNPKSRGTIHLRSKDPLEEPIYDMGYYKDREDLDTNARYLQHFARIQNTKYLKSVDSKLIVPKICGCDENSQHKLEFWKCYARCMMVAGYHFAGSCPMGTVVDSRLRVIGVQNLRVVDAGVMPIITSANTNAPTIMIAEKAADMIKDDNGY